MDEGGTETVVAVFFECRLLVDHNNDGDQLG